MKIIKQKYEINSSLDKVWQALTNQNEINAWGAGPAVMTDKEGSEFKLWGGSIWGKNIEVIKNKKLVQDWFSENEIEEEPSKVTFNLKENGSIIEIELIQENVPDNVYSKINDGWKDYYLGAIKNYLENK